MADTPDPTDRRYTEQELSLILKRASEHDAAHPGGEGLSLAEIQAIAAEVGLSPADVAVAAAQVRAEGAGPTAGAAYEVALPTVLGDAEVERLFDAARDRTGASGRARRDPGGWTWTSSQGLASTRVSVATRGGRSRLAVTGSRPGAAVAAAAAGVVAGIVLAPVAGILFSTLLGGGFLALVLGVATGIAGGLATGWLVMRRMAGRWRERTARLGGELARVAMGLAVGSGGGAAGRLPEGTGPHGPTSASP